MGILGRNRSTAGLDIGSGFIKLVVIDHGKAEPQINQIATRPLVLDAIVDGQIMDPVAVTEAVRSLVEGSELKSKDVNTAVGGHDVIIKRIQMDRMNEHDARAVIRWDAEQHVPFDMENVQLDFQIMDADADGPQMTVLLVAAKRELIENRVHLLAEAGLTPVTIDVDAFALNNAFERSYPELLGGLVALVNVGNETTNVSLVDDGVPILVRDVPFGSRRLREALQRERGLSADRAEAILIGHEDGAPLRALVDDKIDELAIGLERAAAFITAQPGSPRDAHRVGWEPGWESGGVGIGRVFVSGGGACVPGVVEALGRRLGITTEMASPIQRLAVRPEVMESLPLDQMAPMLMLPMGLALRDQGLGSARSGIRV